MSNSDEEFASSDEAMKIYRSVAHEYNLPPDVVYEWLRARECELLYKWPLKSDIRDGRLAQSARKSIENLQDIYYKDTRCSHDESRDVEFVKDEIQTDLFRDRLDAERRERVIGYMRCAAERGTHHWDEKDGTFLPPDRVEEWINRTLQFYMVSGVPRGDAYQLKEYFVKLLIGEERIYVRSLEEEVGALEAEVTRLDQERSDERATMIRDARNRESEDRFQKIPTSEVILKTPLHRSAFVAAMFFAIATISIVAAASIALYKYNSYNFSFLKVLKFCLFDNHIHVYGLSDGFEFWASISRLTFIAGTMAAVTVIFGGWATKMYEWITHGNRKAE